MVHARSKVTAVLAVGLATVGLATATGAIARTATGYVALAGSIAGAVTPQASIGHVAGTEQLTVHVWLTPNLAGASRFADAVSTPGGPAFHHYLSPAGYTQRFGPPASAASAVRAWLARQGFTAVHTDAQHNYVAATAPVSRVESAFRVMINRYRVGSKVIQSNDRAISVPGPLAADVLAVTGLNSTQPRMFHTATRMIDAATPSTSCSRFWGQRKVVVTPPFKGHQVFTKVNCGYSAAQLRGAYGMNATNVGRSQRVALIEIGTPYKMVKTLARYAKVNDLPPPNATQYEALSIGRGNQCGNAFDIEEQLDSEAVYTMAPRADQLLVGGDSCTVKLEGVQALFDAQLAVLNGNGNAPLASMESNSWGITGGETLPRAYEQAAHSIMVRAAAEGVTMLVASGDNPGVSLPASDPYALAVGGTTLGVGRHANRIFETGWSNDDAVKFGRRWFDLGIGRDAAGGGRSLLFAEPDYQQGVVPPGMTHIGVGSDPADRVVPDVSADADANTGILQIDTVHTRRGDRFREFVDGGTSLSAPLVAGILADAQQGQASGFGFVNPAVYSLSGTSAIHDVLPVTSATPPADHGAFCPKALCGIQAVSLFDSQLHAYTDQVTAPGYDTMTGLGTPNGQAFITALRTVTGG